MGTILHITTEEAMVAARAEGTYRGDTLESQGFIHASEHDQVAEVANRLFVGRDDLILLHIDEDRIEPRVVRENLEGGTVQYPHIYGPLNLDAILGATPYRVSENGAFDVPPPLAG